MWYQCIPYEFQFYDSPIKSLRQGVRPYCLKKGFNSMIVRLKARLAYVNTCTAKAFQFYDSPIKSLNMISDAEINTLVSIL